jgi:CubicO group peptidase (beta-lactamase class C family)
MIETPLALPELERWIEMRLQESETPGAAVILERQGEPLLACGFGQRNVAGGALTDIDTVFGSGSVTKSLTALSIMLLQADGKLTIDDPVTRHLPQLRLPGDDAAAITLHHLLTHTSGLPPLPSRHYAWLSQDNLEPFERKALAQLPPREPIRSFTELVTFLGEHRYERHAPAGAEFSYSNEGYNLLGAVIEQLSGQALPDFVRDRILAPCGMTRSALDLRFTLSLDNVTALHVRQDGKTLASANWFNPACWTAAGGLRTTAADLVRFFRMLAQDGRLDGARIAAPATVRKMTTAYSSGLEGVGYGYGLSVTELAGHRLVHHGGGHKGVSAMAGYAPDEGVVCVVLTNLGGAPAGQVWTACIRTALGLPMGPLAEPTQPMALAPETLRSFCGLYRSSEGASFEVALDDAGGLIIADGALSGPAHATAPDALTFTAPGGGEQTIRFRRLGAGDAVTHAFAGGRLIRRREPRAHEQPR